MATDDTFAPDRAVDALLGEYRSAAITRRRVEPGDWGAKAIGHFGYFRPPVAQPMWTEIADWLDRSVAGTL